MEEVRRIVSGVMQALFSGQQQRNRGKRKPPAFSAPVDRLPYLTV